MEPIETQRLRLRLWKDEDFEPVARFFADEGNARHVGGQKDREQAWRFLSQQAGHWALKGFGYWALEEKATGQFVGSARLWKSPAWPELELGYWLLQEHQGKGYASEACRRSIEFARETLRVETLVSYIHSDNTGSIRLAERLGAVRDGTVDLANFGPHDVYRYF